MAYLTGVKYILTAFCALVNFWVKFSVTDIPPPFQKKKNFENRELRCKSTHGRPVGVNQIMLTGVP
jgi:hypothetical protein